MVELETVAVVDMIDALLDETEDDAIDVDEVEGWIELEEDTVLFGEYLVES